MSLTPCEGKAAEPTSMAGAFSTESFTDRESLTSVVSRFVIETLGVVTLGIISVITAKSDKVVQFITDATCCYLAIAIMPSRNKLYRVAVLSWAQFTKIISLILKRREKPEHRFRYIFRESLVSCLCCSRALLQFIDNLDEFSFGRTAAAGQGWIANGIQYIKKRHGCVAPGLLEQFLTLTS